MNRIVKRHYPVEKLPEDLRVGFDPTSRVTVTLVQDGSSDLTALLEAMDASDRPRRSRAEIDESVRAIRED
jgi:hypothetical protein